MTIPRKVKFRPKRISLSKDIEYRRTEILMQRGRHTHAIVVGGEKWHTVFSQIFKDEEDLREYAPQAEFKCYDIPLDSIFRVYGSVLVEDTYYTPKIKFTLDKVLDWNKKVWT